MYCSLFNKGLSLSLSTCIIKVVFTIKIVLQETPPSASNDDTSSNFLARYQQTNNNSSCETPHALSMDHLLRLSHLGAVIVQNQVLFVSVFDVDSLDWLTQEVRLDSHSQYFPFNTFSTTRSLKLRTQWVVGAFMFILWISFESIIQCMQALCDHSS